MLPRCCARSPRQRQIRVQKLALEHEQKTRTNRPRAFSRRRERRPEENVAATKAIEAVEVSWLIDSEEDFSADEQTEMLFDREGSRTRRSRFRCD